MSFSLRQGITQPKLVQRESISKGDGGNYFGLIASVPFAAPLRQMSLEYFLRHTRCTVDGKGCND